MFARINVANVTSGAVRAALLALALIAVTVSAHAQQKPSPAALKLAQEILDLKNAAALFKPMVPGVIERVKFTLLQTNPALRKDLDAVAANLNKVYAPRTAEMLNEFARAYASNFSEAELKELVAFYRSATGKKSIVAEPQIFEAVISGLRTWQDEFAEEVISSFRAEMKKRGHDL
jgi:uncharacterized protein